jgi:ATP-dependent Lon protease
MNPIIFIDELDKVSRTEHGKEIIGILTHLVDTTQNETFQDKYFSGVDLDLSKVLFIFSYNDASLIDRILLDRIHRIKFDPLTLEDKIVITNKYILPEIYEKMGLNNIFEFSNEVITCIIDNYTYECGVRKLKEIMFEIISEINLDILYGKINNNFPITITEEMIKDKYLKERHEIRYVKIPKAPHPGIINGLWANSYGRGGVIPVEVSLFPSSSFLDFKLTGMQGDVMKESMNVAKTIAWRLTNSKRQKTLIKNFEETKLQGIHIHCPEGATPKDGPSAGGAITVAIYSMFNNEEIKNTIAMTGEINIQGNITAIGGLELKIIGGIRAGVKEFIYPEENEKDFKKLVERYEEKDTLNNIIFHKVNHINEVLKLVFV